MWHARVSVLLLGSAAAWAQTTMTGVLVDPTRSAVPEALVVLRGPGLEQSTRTSGTGEFRFENLVPGGWQLEVAAPGFEIIRRTVRVGARPAGRLVLELRLSALREQVTVRAQGEQVSTDIAANRDAVSVERGILENLPIVDLDFLATLSRFLDPSAAKGEMSLVVDGMESRNVGVTASAIQEIRINQNPYTVEYPRWSRRRIEVITKSAADRYHGTFNLVFRDHRLNAREALAATRPPERRAIFEGSLFGPLGSGKNTSLLLSALRENDDLEAVVFAQGLAGPIRGNVPTPTRNSFVSLRITHQVNDRHVVFVQQNYQDRFQNNLGAGGTVLEEAAAHLRFREDEFIFNHRGVLQPKLLSQFRVLVGRYWTPTRSNVARPRLVVNDAFTGGGAQADALRTEFHTSITWLLTQTRGRHTLKYGFNVPDWSRRGLSDRSNELGTLYFGSLEAYARNRPYAGVVQRGDPRLIFVEKNLGMFFQTEWQARANLSVSAGLRYDWQAHLGDRNNVAPRLALAYAPRGPKAFVLRGGAGFFYERSGPGPVWDVLRYDGVRLRRYLISGALPPTLDNLPASVARLDPAVGLPNTMQFSGGLERQLGRRTTLAVQYIGTRGVQQWRSRDANAPLPPLFAARPDPRVNVLRQIESAGRVEGNALEITLRGTLAPKVTGLAQYSFGKTLTDTGGVNWFPADSFDPRGEWGRADTDRRHSFNLLGTAALHRWANFGLSVSAQSGIPFNITTGRDDNRDGLAGDRLAGVTRNTGNGPGFAGIDLRWYRDFRLYPARQDKSPTATLSVDAFNLPNRVNYQNYLGARTSPFFGRAVGTHPARRLQAGVRVQF